MNRKASFNGLAALLMSLSEKEQLALLDRPNEFKKFVSELASQIARHTFFISLHDHEVPEVLTEVTSNWRRLAVHISK